jgi:hypothetical protein
VHAEKLASQCFLGHALGPEPNDATVGRQTDVALPYRSTSNGERGVGPMRPDQGERIELGENVAVPKEHVSRAEPCLGMRHTARRSEQLFLF